MQRVINHLNHIIAPGGSIDYKTLKSMDADEYRDYIDNLSENEIEDLYDSIVSELSQDEEISSKVYWENDYYFTFFNGQVYYMPSYEDCWPKAGSSPDVVTGLSETDKKAVNAIPIQEIDGRSCKI